MCINCNELTTFFITFLAHSHFQKHKRCVPEFYDASKYSTSVSFLASALLIIVTVRDCPIYAKCNAADKMFLYSTGMCWYIEIIRRLQGIAVWLLLAESKWHMRKIKFTTSPREVTDDGHGECNYAFMAAASMNLTDIAGTSAHNSCRRDQPQWVHRVHPPGGQYTLYDRYHLHHFSQKRQHHL